MKTKNEYKKIVIVGGGAGGLELVARLSRKRFLKNKAEITLIDKNLTHIWKPLWHEIAAGTFFPQEHALNYFYHASFNHYNFHLGELKGIDRENKKVICASAIGGNEKSEVIPHEISYDILILAVGSISNHFNIPGAVEHCFFLDSVEQAGYFQQRLLSYYLSLQYQETPPTDTNIVIIGGGATGVELSAELAGALDQLQAVGWYKLKEARITLHIIESGDRILASLPEYVSTAINNQLKALNIQVHTGQKVTRITDTEVHTEQGLFISSKIKIWTAGIKAPEFLNQLDGLETNRLNQIRVKPTLQTTKDEAIFAMGDCAFCPQSKDNSVVPPRAQAATQQARFLVKALRQYINSGPLAEFHYKDRGSLVTLSKQTAVGYLKAISKQDSIYVEGKLARFFYWFLYKKHQLVVFGLWKAGWLTLVQILSKQVRPKLKLH